MNQAIGPGSSGDIPYFMRVLLFTTFLLMGYELSRPNPSGSDKEQDPLLPDIAQERPSLPPWQMKASEKAVVKYAESQEKKWHRWNEAMFERSN